MAATIGSLSRFVEPMGTTLSPVMTARGLDRHLDHLEVDLSDLARVAHAVNATVNDAFVAALTGGLRRYHEAHGTEVAELRMTMPISLRRPGDPAGGNRITLQRFTVPVGEANPRVRIAVTGMRCRTVRHEEALAYTDAIAGALNALPSTVVGSMLKHVDFLASNVPGVPVPLYLEGARVIGYVAYGPTTGASFNATLISYCGTGFVGCTIDSAAVPDPDVLMACLRAGFDEVVGLADDPAPAPPAPR